MCKFSEAILYYCNNKEKAPDKAIEKSSFATQIYATHEVFFNLWIKTSDTKLRQVIIESIGHFVNLMPQEKLESDLSKILPGLLGLYKKHPDLAVISQVNFFLYLLIFFSLKTRIALVN
jgi:maestro heat-like repeat-containing protein family member 1